MTGFLVVIVLGIVAIAASTLLGPRLGVASPLLLVGIGVAASFLPAFGAAEIDPELILEGVLPPLLYSAAVSMPAMNFRREFGAISGLSVVLVVVTSLLLGLFFLLVLPDIGFIWGVALGAIISPTDAVATSNVKRTSISKRVIAMLDGESLLNDATALVLLRTAIVATATAFSFWGTVGSFAYSVLVAAAIGAVVGILNLLVRRRVTDPTVNTLISFAVPFVASVPVALLGGSGLVAAVVAGLVTGMRAPRMLSPQNRLSDEQNWRTVELVLEGVVFLTMGLQLKEIATHVTDTTSGPIPLLLIALGALMLTVLIRAAYVVPLMLSLSRRAQRKERLRPRAEKLQEHLSTPEGKQETLERLNARQNTRGPRQGSAERTLERFGVRMTRALANMDYFRRQPLGWREGVVVVWAGMRGAVTVAAAQTLPADTPQRSALILIAFVVALVSLILQGGTIGWLVPRIAGGRPASGEDEDAAAERRRLYELLRTSAESVASPPSPEGERTNEDFLQAKRHRIAVIEAQRKTLLDARDDGTFDADVLEEALDDLDAAQIAIDLRGRSLG